MTATRPRRVGGKQGPLPGHFGRATSSTLGLHSMTVSAHDTEQQDHPQAKSHDPSARLVGSQQAIGSAGRQGDTTKKWRFTISLDGSWTWRHIQPGTSRELASEGTFPTLALCEADAAAHGYDGRAGAVLDFTG